MAVKDGGGDGNAYAYYPAGSRQGCGDDLGIVALSFDRKAIGLQYIAFDKGFGDGINYHNGSRNPHPGYSAGSSEGNGANSQVGNIYFVSVVVFIYRFVQGGVFITARGNRCRTAPGENCNISVCGKLCAVFYISQHIAKEYADCHADSHTGIGAAGDSGGNHICGQVVISRNQYILGADDYRIFADKGAGGIFGVIPGLFRTQVAGIVQIVIFGFVGGKVSSRLVAVFIFFIKGAVPVAVFAIKYELGFPNGSALVVKDEISFIVFLLDFFAVFILYIFFMPGGVVADFAAVAGQFTV